ncbi:hypothetical protein AMTR_s00009p00221820 [Amborella trichopoda]|uniref:C2 domain-containing protein n=1 Tax=Amborella trichopoda TaxID=13333 RepID=W1NIH1_AMBTC|nr:hypothetical protein AMTR_s00009p00221820 [Amborella trichopoda]
MELEVTVVSAKDLHNVNWRHGDIKPYVAAWVDPNLKSSTRVGYKLTLPLRDRPEDSTLRINVVHGSGEAETKQLIGSATLPLREVIEDAGFDHRFSKTLKLKRLSGRLQGEIQVEIAIQNRYAGYARNQSQGLRTIFTTPRLNCTADMLMVPLQRRQFTVTPLLQGGIMVAMEGRPPLVGVIMVTLEGRHHQLPGTMVSIRRHHQLPGTMVIIQGHHQLRGTMAIIRRRPA